MSKDATNELAFTDELSRAKPFDSAIVGNAPEAVDVNHEHTCSVGHGGRAGP